MFLIQNSMDQLYYSHHAGRRLGGPIFFFLKSRGGWPIRLDRVNCASCLRTPLVVVTLIEGDGDDRMVGRSELWSEWEGVETGSIVIRNELSPFRTHPQSKGREYIVVGVRTPSTNPNGKLDRPPLHFDSTLPSLYTHTRRTS